MTSHEETRLFRLGKIKKAYEDAKKKGVELDKERLVAQCSMLWGASRRTILDYIKTVQLGS